MNANYESVKCAKSDRNLTYVQLRTGTGVNLKSSITFAWNQMHLSFLLLLLYFCYTIDGFLIPHTSQLKCLYISRFHHLISSSNNVIVLPATATTVHHRTRSPLYYYRSTQAPVVLKGPSFSRLSLFSDEETIEFSSSVQFLLKAALLGATTGFTVHLFKYLISLELTLFYENLAAVLPKPVLYWPFIICKHSLLSDLLYDISWQ